MIPLLVVVFDEGGNGLLQLPGEIVMFQANHVLNGTVIPFDFALGLWMVRRTVRMLNTMLRQVISQIARDVSRAVIAQQTGTMLDGDLLDACGGDGEVKRVFDIGMAHASGEFPGDDVPGEIVQHR